MSIAPHVLRRRPAPDLKHVPCTLLLVLPLLVLLLKLTLEP